MSNPEASNPQDITKFRAYQRMKRDNPEEFEPQTIFFATPPREGQGIDWQNCLQLKAAMVYHAITKKEVSNETKSGAEILLDEIAKKCMAEIAKSQDDKGQYSIESIKDGIFLVVVFLSDLHNTITKDGLDRKRANDHFHDTSKQEIVKEIIKIENQLSLKLIYRIAEHVQTAINTVEMKKQLKYDDYNLGFTTKEFGEMIGRFCWYYSPFYSASKKFGGDKEVLVEDVLKKEEKDKIIKLENLLHCLHHSLKKASQSDEDLTREESRCPSARQLKRSGVRFEASSEATIAVRFTEPKLQMPAVAYDFKLETVVRNLLAWECLPRKDRTSLVDQKPMTRYFQLINELAGDLRDVQMMIKFGLIKGWSEQNLQELLDLVKRIAGSVPYRSAYTVLDKEIRKVSQYHEKRMKKFFVRNRPAVLWLSSVAAVSVIGTAIYASRRKRG